MRFLYAVVVVVLAAAAVIPWLGVTAVVVVPALLLLALVVAFNPLQAGSRIRHWPVWRHLPGLRPQATALRFAAVLLLYGIPAPVLSFAVVHAVTTHPADIAWQDAVASTTAHSAVTTSGGFARAR